jgi:hypothetical protein
LETAQRWRVAQHRPGRESADWLSKSIAVAARVGHLLDFPEHPHNDNAEADDDATAAHAAATITT